MAISKHEARDLSRFAREAGGMVLEGLLHRNAAGEWMVGDVTVGEWLARWEDEQVLLIGGCVEEAQAGRRICMTCGTEYEGEVCPRCQEAWRRLRGG